MSVYKKKKKKQTLKHLKNKKDISGFIRNYSCLDSLLLDCLPLKCSKIDEKKNKNKNIQLRLYNHTDEQGFLQFFLSFVFCLFALCCTKIISPKTISVHIFQAWIFHFKALWKIEHFLPFFLIFALIYKYNNMVLCSWWSWIKYELQTLEIYKSFVQLGDSLAVPPFFYNLWISQGNKREISYLRLFFPTSSLSSGSLK